MKIDKGKVKKILLISLSNLGDVILTTPVFQKLREEFPDAAVDVVIGPAGKELFEGCPSVRDIIVSEKHRSLTGRRRYMAMLRGKRYDMAVDLKNTLVPLFLGTQCRSRIFFLSKLNFPREKKPLHKKDEHLLKLRDMEIDTGGAGFLVPVKDKDKTAVDKILGGAAGSRLVVINPGAKSHLKRWSVRKYAELSDRLVSELGCSVFIIGNEDDRDVIRTFTAAISQPVKDLCCRTSVGELMELMSRVSLVITNDSAPLHMASAVNAPTVAIFGPSDEQKYGPLSGKNKVVKPDVPCRPCRKALCATGPDEGCLAMVEVDEVFTAAKKLLEM